MTVEPEGCKLFWTSEETLTPHTHPIRQSVGNSWHAPHTHTHTHIPIEFQPTSCWREESKLWVIDFCHGL